MKTFKVDLRKISSSNEFVSWWYTARDGKCYKETREKEITEPSTEERRVRFHNKTNEIDDKYRRR